MKKTLLSVAALTFVVGSTIGTAQAAAGDAAAAAPTTAGKTVKPAAKHHHKHTAATKTS